ncbi:type IV toxin-antitoxin system AbiEi family antitoxin domain-containing protein [Rhizobium ruizarguesonis]|uniref:type IV toxin-antitoxin system AbiEi family antitoxin domain-containing protein n=1 Tax=Rhizobium ruizarguesonis TaxID=2081791 RepID=UPI0010308730|nr:type IV toxin-antitoxin system AbiEi family antitoxin [Rhizobium ruizarguesonis]TAT71346.1 hypothetical protein ELI56_33735 [Rhizobium ruizarguesonis]TAT74256.1 hypothetical protein ELI52_31120 [Rhizobium ruizarguesonis]TAT81814.1 hypothetical protein ELI54_26840 [Rhizobium ruizarguesonis]TAT93395.1 hypothetical protein ELI53_31325 [Rhizobium ruizarguesonis]TAT94856.1 hypothetical protein ELI55_30640 [Rhizobium ruizarguesonis]
MVDDKLDAAFIQGIPAVATEHLAHTSDPGIPGAKACGSLGVMGFCGGKSYAIKLQPRGDDLSPIICKTPIFLFVFAYDWRMPSLDDCIENKQMSGYSTFTREDALAELSLKPEAFTAALTRQISRKRLANPRHGFYIIPRPEDRTTGAPDPARWIDPLMKYLGTDYRISLLRAAAMHSSSHQAAMVFQVVVPQQFRSIIIGRHRIQFVHLAPSISSATNQKDWLTDTGYAQAAGVELTLLDCIRYFKRATGINGVAQITKDIGNRANPRKLASVAQHFENTSVRQLGYLLDLSNHKRQAADALQSFALQNDKYTPLDPSVRPLFEGLSFSEARDFGHWSDQNQDVGLGASCGRSGNQSFARTRRAAARRKRHACGRKAEYHPICLVRSAE